MSAPRWSGSSLQAARRCRASADYHDGKAAELRREADALDLVTVTAPGAFSGARASVISVDHRMVTVRMSESGLLHRFVINELKSGAADS